MNNELILFKYLLFVYYSFKFIPIINCNYSNKSLIIFFPY